MKLFDTLAAKVTPSDIGYNPTVTDPDTGLTSILNTVYAIAGVVAVLMIIIAGFVFILSRGDSNKVAQARNAIIAASVGLVIIIMAFAITQFVLRGVA